MEVVAGSATDYRLPATGYRLPAIGYRIPDTDYRLPANYPLLILLSDFPSYIKGIAIILLIPVV